MRWHLFVGLAAVLLPTFGGCDEDDPPPPVVFRAPGVGVKVSLDPFAIEIDDAIGAQVLRSLTGDDATPYGGPAATHDVGAEFDTVKGLPGWDGYAPDEEPWSHAT